MKTEKAINKAFSIRPSQLEEIYRVVDITRYGNFSQFLQDAIQEKLDRISQQQEKKAS